MVIKFRFQIVLITVCLLSSLYPNPSFAQSNYVSSKTDSSLSIEASNGYNQENLRWSIAGTLKGSDPNIYSELSWKGLSSYSVNLGFRAAPSKFLVIEVKAGTGFVFNGKVTDSDYQNDNRQYQSFYGLFDSNKGSVQRFETGVGTRLLKSKSVKLELFGGFSCKRQNLYLLDEKGIYDKNLRSTYKNKWTGPFIELESCFFLGKRFLLEPTFVYHQISYSAKGNWNLISDFKHPESYSHSAKGFGLVSSFALRYHCNKSISIYAEANSDYWATGQGIDRLYLVNGQRPETRLNEVVSTAFGISVGAKLEL